MGPKTNENAKVKINWTTSETEFLVDEFILRKDIILGSFSAFLTKEKKHRAWDEIVANLKLEFPDSIPKDKQNVKKKWDNLMREARAEIQKHNACIRGTGGGPSFAMKPINVKIHEKVIGKENPALTSIPGGLDTDIAEESQSEITNYFHGNPLTEPFEIPLNATTLEIVLRDQSHENTEVVAGEVFPYTSLPGTSRGPSSSTSPNTYPTTTADSSENPFFTPVTAAQTPTVARKGTKLTLRQRENASKRKSCELNDIAAEKRVLRERIKLLHAVFEFRLLSGNPVVPNDYPEDLRDLLVNPSVI